MITRTLVFQEMVRLVAGGEEQKEDGIRAEESEPCQPQGTSLRYWSSFPPPISELPRPSLIKKGMPFTFIITITIITTSSKERAS